MAAHPGLARGSSRGAVQWQPTLTRDESVEPDAEAMAAAEQGQDADHLCMDIHQSVGMIEATQGCSLYSSKIIIGQQTVCKSP